MSATPRTYIPGETQIIAEKLVKAERLFFGKDQKWLTEEDCKVLIQYHPSICDTIKKYFRERIKSVSIMPYDGKIKFCIEPAYIGCNNIRMTMSNENHTMAIIFDRN